MADVLSVLDWIAALLFAGAIGLIALTPEEIKVASILVWIAAILFAVRWVMWALITECSWQIRIIVGAVVGAFLFGVLPPSLKWISDKSIRKDGSNEIAASLPEQPIAAPDAIPPSLYEEQLRELREIEEFIGKKDENELRETFDLPTILKFNIKFDRRDLVRLIDKSESNEIDRVFSGGQARLDVRYANISNVNNTAHVEWIPGKIGVINTTAKYVESRKRLNGFILSAKLPSNVVNALKGLDDMIERDLTMMVESLNDRLSDNKDNIIQEFNQSSVFYGGTSGYYWTRFSNLRPEAERISKAIREYLKIK
jgi:hypothetical protein